MEETPEPTAPSQEYVYVSLQDTNTTAETLRRDCFGFILLYICIILILMIIYMYARWSNGKQ